MTSQGMSLRGLFAVCGGVALFMWGLAVALGTGIGYYQPIASLIPVSGRVLWQLLKGACLITMAVAVVKEEIYAAESRERVAFLEAKLNKTS